MQKNGQFTQEDYFDNVGGLNLSDSPFKVKSGQATGGLNYSYTQTGGIKKRAGHTKFNSVADTALRTLGLALYNTAVGAKTVVRAAGRKIQAVDVATPSFTAMSEDTLAAGTNFLAADTTAQVVWSQFNNGSSNILFAAGGGMSSIYGVYSASKVTANGAVAPTGSITATPSATGTGSFLATGTYRYAVALRKASTGALSNASFSQSATISNTTDIVTISLTSITAFDTTKYDQFYIYRSAVSGAQDFTTGDLIAQISTASTSYVDLGSNILDAENVPRAANLVLDNSPLPAGTYNTVALYKRCLVTASDSTLYFSDLNKPESWPLGNTITVPSGGPITGLAVLGFTSSGSNTIDEILCVFKEREVWVVTGSTIEDYALKFIDSVGAPNQSVIVSASGFLAWVNSQGVYLWDGTGKPVYASKPVEALFAQDGDIDKSKLGMACGQYYRKDTSIIWLMSHKIYGEQKVQLKLDLRLTLPAVSEGLAGRIIDGVFLMDSTPFACYSALSYLPTTPDEILVYGDDSGFIYNAFSGESDAGTGVQFAYQTKFLDMDNPNVDKRFNYVVVWVEEVGDWDLTMDFWTDFKSSDGQKSTRALRISDLNSNALALWDVAYWDVAFWDDYNVRLRPIWFQLSSDAANLSEGKCIKLQFRNNGANEPVSILGYSILTTPKGVQK